jgi:putative membrane protein
VTVPQVSPLTTPVTPPRRLSPLTPLVRAPLLMVAFLSATWQQLFAEQGIGRIGLVLGGLLVAGAGYGTASWLRTTYVITGEELRIDTGVVARQSRRIRIDRLQGVDILQPLVARLFGLAELRLDVAGGDREGRLAYLPRREAEGLRSVLLVRRDQLALVDTPLAPPVSDQAAPPGPMPVRQVATLDLGRLLGSLVLSSESFFLLATAVALVVVSVATGTVALTGGLVPAALGAAVSLSRKLTGYYGFTLTESAEGLQVRRGLTSLSSQTVALERVQGVIVREPLLWRPLGWARLDVSVAGNLAVDTGKAEASSTLMPVAPRGEVLGLARAVLRGRDPAAVAVLPTPRRARWLAPLTAWNLAAGQDDRLLVTRRGFWVRRLDAVPQERTQSVRLTQGPLQRRLQLASVAVDSPPGPVQVVAAHRDGADARRFLEEAVARGRAARRGAVPLGVTSAVTERTQASGDGSERPT